jgi:predicted DCC family thiol-disulfide oxidoreductase YuxK
MARNPSRSPTKVYYNSACPVCNAGIKDQRQRMEACGIKDIEWVDVHTNPEAVSEVNASLEQVRERLYVKDSDGQLNVGADAFTRLWSQTRGQRWLAKLLRLPMLRQLTHLAYNVFARLLYRWNRAKGRW